MRRNTNQTQSKFFRITEWFSQNRIKSAVLVFASLVVLGSATGLIIKLLPNSKPQAASQQLDVQSVDAIPGWWYQEHFGLSVCEQDKCQLTADPDTDKLTNAQEYFYNSDPNNADTNANGNTDGEDVAFGYAPNKPGKTTFEQAGSDDNIVGESLLFNDEVKDVIVGMTDLSKTVLPEVKDSELVIINENSQKLFIDYMLALDQVSQKFYKSADQYAGLSEQVTQQNKAVTEELKITALQVASEYKKVPVPSDALQFHKYQIALWQLIPTVVDQPLDSDSDVLYDSSMNKWFDSAQAMIALNQKIVVELMKLRTKYEFE